MKTKPKDQGTAYETARVNYHRATDLKAGRLTEGGSKDLGDLWIGFHPEVEPELAWVEEAKARASLNPHVTLANAIRKAGHKRVLLSHKRLTRKAGNTRRTPDGLVEIVCMHPDTAEELLAAFIQRQVEV